MDSRENLISLVTEMFDKCVNAVAKNVNDPEEQNEHIQVLESSIFQLADMDIKHKHFEKVIEESKDECLNNNTIKFTDLYKANVKVLHPDLNPSVESHRFVKHFRQKTSNITASENSVPTETAVLLLDPITKNPIVKPVKNKKCGHLYEKSSIKKMCSKKKMLCPYIGCARKDYFRYEDLEEDVSMSQQDIENLEV